MRALLNDQPANWATDTVLLPYVSSVYRTVQKKVANAGGGGFIQDNTLLVVPAVVSQDASTQVVINDATAPPNQLPSNLLVPLKIEERPNLSTQDFIEMADLSQHGGLPSRLQGQSLNVWEWRADGLYFLGATQDTQIRLRFLAAYPDVAGATDPILIRGAVDCIAHGAAAMAGFARGSPLADKMEGLFTDLLEDVILENVRREQNTGRRRRAFGMRGSNQGYGRTW